MHVQGGTEGAFEIFAVVQGHKGVELHGDHLPGHWAVSFKFYFLRVTGNLPFQTAGVYTLYMIFGSAYFPTHSSALGIINPFILSNRIDEKWYLLLICIESL